MLEPREARKSILLSRRHKIALFSIVTILVLAVIIFWYGRRRGGLYFAFTGPAKPLVWNPQRKTFASPNVIPVSNGSEKGPFDSFSQAQINREAKRILHGGYAVLASASKWRRTVVSRYSDNNYVVFDLTYQKDKANHESFRNETTNIDGQTLKENPVLGRTEITNTEGNWVLSTQPGSEDVAFLLTTKDPLADTVAIKTDLERKASAADSLPDSDYSISPAMVDGSPAYIVATTWPQNQAQFIIDRLTGALLSRTDVNPGLTTTETYDLTVDVESSAFSIPDSKIIMPTSNLFAAQAYLMENKNK